MHVKKVNQTKSPPNEVRAQTSKNKTDRNTLNGLQVRGGGGTEC